MVKSFGISVCLASAALVQAAGLPKTQLQGEYVEARTADVYTGACFANSEVGLTGRLAVFGWRIDKGSWQGVKLDGLAVAAAVRASNTLGDQFNTAYPVKAVLIVDERAGMEQRLALKSFAQRMGGDLLQDIARIEYQPVRLDFEGHNLHAARATLTAGTLAKIQTRALADGDHICHNEEVWYKPLTRLDNAMPAFTVAHDFRGRGLDTVWSSPDKRSAFVGSFHYAE